jgi:hypothetical protein
MNSITVTVTYRGETRDLGVWDTWEGAAVTAENTKHRRGAMGIQVAVGGAVTIEDVTITRDYDLARDHLGKWPTTSTDMTHWMANAVGKSRVVATKQFLDADGLAFGKPIVISGILIGYTIPGSDSDSSEVGMVEIVINPDGEVG